MPPQGQTTEDVLKRLARMGLSMPSKSAPPPTPKPSVDSVLEAPQGPMLKIPERPSSEGPASQFSPGLLGTFQRLLMGAFEAGGSALGVRDPLDPKSTKADILGGLGATLLPVGAGARAVTRGRKALKGAEEAAAFRVRRPESGTIQSHNVSYPQSVPGKAYRGMEAAEYEATVGAGKPVQSRGDYSHSSEGTKFGDDFETAESYVNFGQSDPRKTGKPNYIVEVDAKGLQRDPRDSYLQSKAPVQPSRVWKIEADAEGGLRATLQPMPSHAPTQAGGTLAQAMQPIKAYHGSPHDFDKFSLEKIGTGEGAQAYGHGLYFAENEGVANEYRKDLTRRPIEVAEGKPLTKVQQHILDYLGRRNIPVDDKAVFSVGDAMTSAPFDIGPRDKATWDKWRAEWEDMRPRLSQTEQPGRTYEVGLHASPDDFLDWDKPLSQQSEKVRKIAAELKLDGSEEALYEQAIRSGFGKEGARKYAREQAYEPTGEHVYAALGRNQAGSDKLKAAGIKGIRYLDQGSRGMPEWRVTWKDRVPTRFDTKEQAEAFLAENKGRGALSVTQEKNTSNYVVFDEDIIDIRKKFMAMLAAGAGAAAAKQAAEAKNKKKGG